MDSSKPSSKDFLELYEHLLIQYNNIHDENKEFTEETAARALILRAQRIGLIEYAEEVASDPTERNLLRAFAEQVSLEMNREAGKSLSVFQIDDAPGFVPRSDNFRLDLDNFFEDYPDCIGPQDDESSSEDEVSDSEMERKMPNKKVADMEREKLHAPSANVATNPYAARPQPGLPNRKPSSTVDLTTTSVELVSHRDAPRNSVRNKAATAQAWEDHRSQNPFQTAREFAWTEDKNHQTNNVEPPRMGYNPYLNPPPQPAISDHQPLNEQQAPIRDSLKRKFQPPKRVTENTTNHSTNSQARNPRPTARGGGTASLPSVGPNDKSENDDLPEELQRFGKELVEKIESEIMDIGDPITFDDIAGLEDAKQTVQEVVCWPMKRPDLFTGLRKAPNGLLLYGPPGTGKTLIGKAISHESGATFFSISSSSLTSKWIGEGEKLVRTLFAVAAYREPAVVFIDEIDSLLTQRKADENEASRRIKTEFLVQLDGTGTSGQGRVLVIGATNRPQELDEAARRRFTKRLYIPLPTQSDREILLKVLLTKNNHVLSEAEIKKLAVDTNGFSGADLKALSTDAAMGPIRQLGAKALEVDVKDVPPISYRHFKQALRAMQPSVAPSDLVQYEEWDKLYGSKRADSVAADGESDDD